MADQANENVTNTIFNSEAPVNQVDDNQPIEQKASQPLPIPEELQDFIGEGKKYSSIEDALKSIPHAQKHISTLEQENQTYKQQVEKVKSMEELLEQMKAQQNTKEQPTVAPVGNEGADDLLDKLAQQMETLVEQKLAMKQQQDVQQQNKAKVVDAFKQAYGDKANEVYTKLSEETGMPLEALNNLAATSPKALMKLAGLSGQAMQSSQKPNSSVNTEAFIANASSKPVEAKPVMYGATTADILSTWRASKPV